MDDGTRGRVQLYLRGERAMGLTSLPVRLPAVSVPPVVESAARRPRPAAPAGDTPPAAGQRSAKAPPAQAAAVAGGTNEALSAGGGLMPPPSREGFASPVLSSDEKRVRLQVMDESEVTGCT